MFLVQQAYSDCGSAKITKASKKFLVVSRIITSELFAMCYLYFHNNISQNLHLVQRGNELVTAMFS